MHYETPTAASLYTRYWTEAVDFTNMITVPKGFQSIFGPAQGSGGKTRFVTDSTRVDFDVRDGKQEITTLVHRGMVAQPLNKDMLIGGKFTSFSRAFPLGEDHGIISADQIKERSFSEQPYQPLTQFQRMRNHLTDMYDEMIRRAIRTQEILAAQMVKTGKMDLVVGETGNQIDTKRLATHTLTIAASWATASTDILGDMDTGADVIIQDSGAVCDAMLMGANVPGYLAGNTAIQTYANLAGPAPSGFQIVYFGDNVRPAPGFNNMIANGFNPICQLVTPKGRRITCLTYEGGYKNSSGTFIPYIGNDEVIFMASSARADRYFGPNERLPMTTQEQTDYRELFGFDVSQPPLPPNVENINNVIVPQEFYPDIVRSQDHKSLMARLQYAPMFITTDTNAFAFADVTP